MSDSKTYRSSEAARTERTAARRAARAGKRATVQAFTRDERIAATVAAYRAAVAS